MQHHAISASTHQRERRHKARQSFVMIRHEPAAIPDRIDVVLGWFEELDRLVSGEGAG